MRDYNHNFSAARTRARGNRRAPAKPAGRSRFVEQLVVSCFIVGIVSWNVAPQLQSAWTRSTLSPEEVARREASVFYGGCNEARAAGAAPVYAGQPGYRAEMDGDGDGIACEPHRRF